MPAKKLDKVRVVVVRSSELGWDGLNTRCKMRASCVLHLPESKRMNSKSLEGPVATHSSATFPVYACLSRHAPWHHRDIAPLSSPFIFICTFFLAFIFCISDFSFQSSSWSPIILVCFSSTSDLYPPSLLLFLIRGSATPSFILPLSLCPVHRAGR
jgi:hypothetical protein